MAARRILIFAEDPRLCRLLLREAVAAGWQGQAITEVDKLEEHYRDLEPSAIVIEVERSLERLQRFISLVSSHQSGSLVLLGEIMGPPMGELMRLADARGVKIAGTLHKPMGIEAIRALFRHLERVTPHHPARLTTPEVNHEPEQVRR